MLKNIKKGEVIIYAIALMLVAAGYLNYTSTENANTIETYSEEIASIGDAVLVSNDNVIENKEENVTESELINNKEIDSDKEEENLSMADTSSQDISKNIQSSSESDYFTTSKLDRDTMYANMISSYLSILENSSIPEPQKSIANQEISKINNTKNSIMICENLLSTKGFDKCLVLINNESVNVVIGQAEKLSTEQVAQIQNIISRELNTKITDIHISQKS